MASRNSRAREGVLNILVFALSFGLIYLGMEVYVSLWVDDGMQYDLEMWRYARSLKQVSSNALIGHEHRPNTNAHLMGVDVQINSDGLRDRKFAITRSLGVTRVMMLGDSLTFGWGVPLEKTYSKVLEAKLLAAGHKVEVINAGVGNYNTSMEVEYFLQRGAKYKPDIVVLNYFINDAETTPSYETNILSRNLRAYVYFASRFDSALRQADVARLDWKDYYKSLYDPGKRGEQLAIVRDAIGRLSEYCRTHNMKLFVANYPELRLLKNYPFGFVDEFVRKIAESNRIPYLSLIPAVRDMEPSTLWVTVPDPHPNSIAHEAFAAELFRIFESELRRLPTGSLSFLEKPPVYRETIRDVHY